MGRPGTNGTVPGRDWRFWGVLGLSALVLGLLLATPDLDSDQAVTGLMGVHILRGEFPIFFWMQDHAGVPESYGAAVTFFLFGVSRVSLSLVPALAALGLVLALYRTGAVLFGHGAGLLAILFATVVSPYVAGHYVLARAYYMEQLLAGQVVLLGAALWLARGCSPPNEPARSRALLAMGLAGGLGLYCNFQIVGVLVPAALALMFVDPRLPLRRSAWLGLGAFGLGSTPFWVYNLTHDWATFATGARFEGRQSAGEAARILFADHLPKLLGVQDFHRALPDLPWALAWAAPTIVMAASAVLAVRVGWGLPRLRGDPALAGEAMLLVAAVVIVALVWAGRFVSAPRYLLPLCPVLALILARTCQLTWRHSRNLAAAGAAAYLLAVGVGLVRDLTVLWPASRARYAATRAWDEALIAFLRARGLHHVYSRDYWLAPRLTFDAREEIIVGEPFDSRYPAYTAAVDAAPRPAYITRVGAGLFENALRASGAGAERTRVGPYTVFWEFVPPRAAVPVSRAGWSLRTGPGAGEPESIADARLDSDWRSTPGPPGTAWVEVDLGQVRRISGVTLVADRPGQLPRVLDVALDDGRTPNLSVARVDTGDSSVSWQNGAPRMVRHTLTVRFAPVGARRVRLTDLGPAGTWAVAELFILGPADASRPASHALEEGHRLETAGAIGAALVRYREAMTLAPDDPEGYAEFSRLAAEIGGRAGSPAEQAALFARFGLTEEARRLYTRLAADLGTGRTHVELTERRARLATDAGDLEEAARLRADAATALAPRGRVGAVLGRVIELTGYDLTPTRARPGEHLDLAYYWRMSARSRTPLAAYLHLRGEAGQKTRALAVDDHGLPAPIPGLGAEPQHVTEHRRVMIPTDAQPGRYRVVIGVRDPTSGSRLRRWWRGLVPTTSHTIEVGTLEILPRP